MLRVTKADSIHAGQTIYAFGKQYKLEQCHGELYDFVGVCKGDGHLIMLDKVYKTKYNDDAGGFYYRALGTGNDVAILQDSQLNVVIEQRKKLLCILNEKLKTAFVGSMKNS